MPVYEREQGCERCGGSGIYTERFHLQPTDRCYACNGTGRAEAAEVVRDVARPPLSPEEFRDLVAWARQHGSEMAYMLAVLGAADPTRYYRAISSIQAGRGQEVADALAPWFAEYQHSIGRKLEEGDLPDPPETPGGQALWAARIALARYGRRSDSERELPPFDPEQPRF